MRRLWQLQTVGKNSPLHVNFLLSLLKASLNRKLWGKIINWMREICPVPEKLWSETNCWTINIFKKNPPQRNFDLELDDNFGGVVVGVGFDGGFNYWKRLHAARQLRQSIGKGDGSDNNKWLPFSKSFISQLVRGLTFIVSVFHLSGQTQTSASYRGDLSFQVSNLSEEIRL